MGMTEKEKEYNRRYYQANKERIKKKSSEYYKNNRDSVLERVKEYSLKNKDKISEYQAKYTKEHKEDRREYLKIYNEKNSEMLKKKNHEYALAHKEEKAAYDKEYRKKRPPVSPQERANKLYHNYKRNDSFYNREGFDLSREWIVGKIFNSPCIYCGDTNWRHLGCDRIDNSKPHTPENCVCSCGICNIERQGKNMSVEEFIEYRKTNPRDKKPQKLQEIVEVNGKKVIKKAMSA